MIAWLPALMLLGLARAEDPDRLLDACVGGDEQACTALYRGRHRRMEMLERACHGMHAASCLELAHALSNDASASDPEDAGPWLEAACRAGHQETCRSLESWVHPEISLTREGVVLDGTLLAHMAGAEPWTFGSDQDDAILVQPLFDALRDRAARDDLGRPGGIPDKLEIRVDPEAPSGLVRRLLTTASDAGWRHFHVGLLGDADSDLVRSWLPALASAREQHPAIRAAAEARPGGAVLRGVLSFEEVKRGIHPAKISISACWERTTHVDRSLDGGRVVVRLVIGPQGTVTDIALPVNELPHPTMERCILEAFRTLRFPAPQHGGAVTISYPLQFERSDAASP